MDKTGYRTLLARAIDFGRGVLIRRAPQDREALEITGDLTFTGAVELEPEPGFGLTIDSGLTITGELNVGASPAAGTSGQFLQSQGDDTPPEWADVSLSALDALVTITEDTDEISSEILQLRSTRATRAANDEIFLSFYNPNSTGDQKETGRISSKLTVATASSERSQLELDLLVGGAVSTLILSSTTATQWRLDKNILLNFPTATSGNPAFHIAADNPDGTDAYGLVAFQARTTSSNAASKSLLRLLHQHVGAGTPTALRSLHVAPAFTSTGDATNLIGLYIADATKGSSGGPVNQYGIYIEDLTAGSTLDVGLYIADADTYAIHVDAGAVKFDGALEVLGSVTLYDELNVGATPGAGTSGYLLASQGDDTPPEWIDPSTVGVTVFKGSFTRDMTAASGNVAITGVGFTPKAIINVVAGISGGISAGSVSGSGTTGGVSCMELDYINGKNYIQTGALAIIRNTGGGANYQQIDSIVSFDSDGFTIHWTKTGSPTGTGSIEYIAIG